MSSIEYKDSSLGLTVGLEFATNLVRFQFSDNIWFSIARVIVKAIDKVLLEPIKNLVLHVVQIGEMISIAWENSKARIRVGKIMEVSKTYEDAIYSITNGSRMSYLSQEKKASLIHTLEQAKENQLSKIIEYG